MSISATQKKRGRPPTGVTPQVNVRLAPDVIDALDHFVRENPTMPEAQSRSELLRFIITEWLAEKGFYHFSPEA